MTTTRPTSFADSMAFLYTGPNAVQRGVAPGPLQPYRLAVLRGRVLDSNAQPLAKVLLTVLGHPEYGSTLTRDDGLFDLAVNGGQPLTLVYTRQGLLPVQRQVSAPWKDFAWAPDVVMLALDSQVTAIDLATATTLQTARSSPVTDADGTRQVTLQFSPGTTAVMVVGESTQPLTTLHVRATEYTVGPQGPQRMPAGLPPSSGYTYAVELSVDEALAAGATQVRFSQPVYIYVDNFAGFPVGGAVPSGYYDSQLGQWVASQDGRVLKVLGVTNGLADLDLDGTGTPANATALAALDLSDAERRRLASTAPGTSLWRVPVMHFSAWDFNWPFGPPSGAQPPPFAQQVIDWLKDYCQQQGSIIGCEDQSLAESLSIPGTPYSLRYHSGQSREARRRHFTTPISGPTVPSSLKRIEVEFSGMGLHSLTTFPPEPNQTFTFNWDGKDAYGREPVGAQPIQVKVGYVYEGVSRQPAAGAGSPSFGLPSGSNIEISGNRVQREIILARVIPGSVGGWDNQPGRSLGGWNLDVHHTYLPSEGTLVLGTGNQRKAAPLSKGMWTVAGNGTSPLFEPEPDGTPALKAGLNFPKCLAVGPDGTVYFAEEFSNSIRKVTPEGTLATVAGNGSGGPSPDGVPANQVGLDAFPAEGHHIAVGPDGTLYFAESYKVRKVGPDGLLGTVAGNGDSGPSSGDGGAARDAVVHPSSLAVGPDGSVYFSEEPTHTIRRVGTNGIVTTFAGNGVAGYSGDGGPATQAKLGSVNGMSFGPDGSLYFVDTNSFRIRRIGIDGVIKTVPGGELTGMVWGIALGPDGSIYYAEAGPWFQVIRRILPDGSVVIVAGANAPLTPPGFNGEVGMATQTLLNGAFDVAFAPDGRLYVMDYLNNRIRRVGAPIAGASAGELLIPSDDGGELFFFTSEGQHQKTINTLTGALISRFGYNSAGRLESVTDGDGNMTRLLYDASGNPTAIVAPGGQRSILTVDPHGYLASVTHPSAEPYQLTHTAEGLLTSLRDPRGGLHRFTYNARGLLIKDENPAGGSSTLARTETLAGHTTTLTSALGGKSSYQVTQLSPEELSRVVTTPAGARTEGLESGAATTVTQPNGVVTTLSYGPDPRWGLLAPLPVTRTQVTPGGLSQSITVTRTATLLDPSDLLSLERYTETMSINGRDYSTTYETATRQYVETSPAGRQRTRTLDAKGNTVKLDIAPSVSPATFDYDARGRMSRMAQGAQSATFAHDARDRVSSRTDAAGGVIRYDFDDSDRLRSTTLPSGRMYRFDYDANGNRTRITMPSGAIHGLTYTAGDLLASYAPPSGASLSQSYDLDTRITRATLSSGRSVDAAYDATGRLTGRFFPEASVGFTYGDATERLSTVTRTPTGGGPAQSFGYTYDGELWKTLTFTGPATGTFTYRYDSNFFLVGLRFTGLPETALTYDADGQVKSFGPFTWTHGGPHGTTTSIADAQLKSTFVQDSLGRLQGRTDTVASRPLYAMQLTYDAAGRTVQKVESVAGTSHTFAYAYDADSQLVQVHQDGALLEQYAYDVNGNRTHRTRGASAPEAAAYDGRDQLQRSGTTDYTFDADGFLTQRGNEHFTYSTHGELLRYVSGATTVTYGYDGIGRRTSRTSSAGTEQYLYGNPSNPFQLTHSRDTAGQLNQFFYDETGRLFALERGGSRYYVGADALGTPRVVSSAEGAVVKTLDHDAFGVLQADSAPGFALPIGFAGGLQDPVTGLVRFGLRDYEPATGRWTARDPLLFDSAEANLYLYVNNNPVGLRDPVGLFSVRAAVYVGVGVGTTVAITSKGLSVCGEVGAGLGESLQVDLFGNLSPTGVSLKASARVNVGGAGAELAAELSRVQCSARGIAHVGSKSVTTGNLLQGPRTGTDELSPVENGVRHTHSLSGDGKLRVESSLGVSAQVQASVQFCTQLPF